jgi:AcrR family transcriptional regulator
VHAEASLREQQKRARKERIFRAAMQLFQERGFHETTVLDIARAAEVSRGTFFNYYPYKEAILLEYAAGRLDGLAQAVEERLAEDADALATLQHIFEELAGFVATNRALILPLSYELLNPDPKRARAAIAILPLAQIIGKVLERGQKGGQIRQDLSKERLGRTLANAYFITALQWAAYRSDRSIHEEMQLALRLNLEGLVRECP